ncbi:MAG: hypothetical protein APR53_09715 [Methanoculleus sp. SDB]|nr:MAG: hypothetical protein APR53_09715 [Methanoculleus sp. SDB]
MKKYILIIGILVFALLVAGCAKHQPAADAGDDAGVTPTPPLSAGKDTGNVTQADLDKLKEKLEGLEYEDLGGLSD